MQTIKTFEHSIFPLFHGPRRYNFIRMLPCVVDFQCVSGFENFVTGNTRVGHVQMDLCMSLNSLLLREGLVTLEAKKFPIMSPRYHLVHQRIQGCCGHVVKLLVTLARKLLTLSEMKIRTVFSHHILLVHAVGSYITS